MNLDAIFKRYKEDHINMSGSEERRLADLQLFINKHYVLGILEKKECKCGRMFLPSNGSKWCEQHSGNSAYQDKMKSIGKGV